MVPDYYAMLGLEPSADRAAIEAALGRCQPKWSAGTRNPKHKHTYQSYLDQIPAIRQTLLGDPASRAAYDAELFAGRRLERDRLLDALMRLVRLRAAKGGLTVSDRDRLRQEATRRGLTIDDLDRLIEPIPPRPEAPKELDPPDPPADVIEPATRRQIRLTLEHLRRRDLYDVLGLPRDAPAVEVLARADFERQRWMRKSQVTAEKTAWLEAVSYAQSHLGTPEARGRYDRTLKLEAEEDFGQAVGFTIEGEPRLEPGTKSALIDEATALGIAPDRAEQLLKRACRTMGVALDGVGVSPDSSVPFRLLRCRSCSGVTDFRQAARSDAPACRHCGASLHWACPVCRRTRWVDEARCSCGFPLEHLETFLQHFEAAQHAHRSRDFASALAHLARVQEFAPNHVGARKGVEKIKEKIAEIDRLQSAFEVEMARHNLLASRDLLRTWAALVDPTDTALTSARATWTRELRDVRALLARADALVATDPAEARRAYRQALALAADLPEAADGLRRCPPDPPSDLIAEVEGDRVRLRWTPPTPDGLGPIAFRVVRKRRGVPATPNDGPIVAETSASECEDPGIKPGEVIGYAVFSRRDGVASIDSASVGPVFVLADVSDLRFEVRSREVSLFWTLPEASTGVRVVRKLGSVPTGPDDGQPVGALRDGARDTNLEDDHVYHYGIYAEFRTPEGKLRRSRGVLVSVMPHPLVPAVEELSIAQEDGGRVRVSWIEPERGQVKVVRTSRPLEMGLGQRISTAQAEAIEGHWLPTSATDHAIDPRPPGSGVCYYTPLTYWSGALTVGRSLAFSSIPDPTDLRAVRVGGAGRVHLRWRWSPRSVHSLVLYKAGAFADSPDDPEAHRQVVQEEDYGRQGYLALSLPTRETNGRAWHVTVYAVATSVEGRDLAVSPGVEPTARTVVPGPNPEVTVSYSIRRPTFPGRGWKVAFRTEPPGASIPPMALVGHPRTVPLSADDGELLDQFPATRDGASFRIRPDCQPAEYRLRIFADPWRLSPDQQAPIRLIHPESEQARV